MTLAPVVPVSPMELDSDDSSYCPCASAWMFVLARVPRSDSRMERMMDLGFFVGPKHRPPVNGPPVNRPPVNRPLHH